MKRQDWDWIRLSVTTVCVALAVQSLSCIARGRAVDFSEEMQGADCIIEVDTTQDVHPISPYIYGMADAPPRLLKELRLGSNRWGGNPNSRYNWEKGNCWNAARDWEFRNGNYDHAKPEDREPSGVADAFVSRNKAAGAATVLTIPTIGYVARNDNNETRSMNAPKEGGLPVSPGSEAIADYDPTENQRRTSVKSYAKKPGAFEDPPNRRDDAVYQDEWVYHLTRKFGKANSGGVTFYAMDNEPDLWDATHTDIHPVRPGYDDLLARFLEYAKAVKAVDPTAQITGPVSWGWTGYLHSPRDRGDERSRPDRRAHGDKEFIPWFLEQMRQRDQRIGKRTLDALDIHYYPQAQGLYPSKRQSEKLDEKRIRSTRSLWDSTYTDESWIGKPIRLIPRMKEWISANYPGTKLGITEWNFGGGGTMAGAVATAEALGVFGREDVYLANFWTHPRFESPAFFAFKMFRNADGNGSGFGDQSVRAVSSKPNDISCFASVDTKTGEPVLLIINKQPTPTGDMAIRLQHSKPVSRVSLWRYSGENSNVIVALPEEKANGGSLRLRLPGYSLTLARFR